MNPKLLILFHLIISSFALSAGANDCPSNKPLVIKANRGELAGKFWCFAQSDTKGYDKRLAEFDGRGREFDLTLFVEKPDGSNPLSGNFQERKRQADGLYAQKGNIEAQKQAYELFGQIVLESNDSNLLADVRAKMKKLEIAGMNKGNADTGTPSASSNNNEGTSAVVDMDTVGTSRSFSFKAKK